MLLETYSPKVSLQSFQFIADYSHIIWTDITTHFYAFIYVTKHSISTDVKHIRIHIQF
jgi:hypothetical protein